VVTRAVAAALDLVVIVLAGVGCYLVISGISFVFRPWKFHFPTVAFLMGLTCTLLLLILYLTVTWSWFGRSYGARVMGLRVIDSRGRSPRLLNALTRAVLSVVLPVGLFWCLVSRDRCSLPDVICRTSVVYDWSSGSASGPLTGT